MGYTSTFFDTVEGHHLTNAILKIARNIGEFEQMSKNIEEINNTLKSVLGVKERNVSNCYGLNKSEAFDVYQAVQHKFLVMDAQHQYIQFLYNSTKDEKIIQDIDADNTNFYIGELMQNFGNDIFDLMAQKFASSKDCNIADNDMWQQVVKEILATVGCKVS